MSAARHHRFVVSIGGETISDNAGWLHAEGPKHNGCRTFGDSSDDGEDMAGLMAIINDAQSPRARSTKEHE